MDIDVLTAFVRVLADWKPGQTPVTGDWIRGYDAAMEGIAKQARQTLELARWSRGRGRSRWWKKRRDFDGSYT